MGEKIPFQHEETSDLLHYCILFSQNSFINRLQRVYITTVMQLQWKLLHFFSKVGCSSDITGTTCAANNTFHEELEMPGTMSSIKYVTLSGTYLRDNVLHSLQLKQEDRFCSRITKNKIKWNSEKKSS